MEQQLIIQNYDYLQMSSHRENPFTRPSMFSYYSGSPAAASPYYSSRVANDSSAWGASRVPDNPFEKSKYDQVFSRKNYQSENRSASLDTSKHYGTYFPLSKYQSRLKLRQIDTEIWKRQKQQQERFKLQHYGSQALRYSSYSTNHSSFNHNLHRPQSPKIQRNQFSKENFEQSSRSIKKKDSDSPRKQYMGYNSKQDRYKNADSNTSIVNTNKWTDYQRPHYQKQYSSRGDINNSNKNNTYGSEQKSSQLNRKNTAFFNSNSSDYFEGSFNKNFHANNTLESPKIERYQSKDQQKYLSSNNIHKNYYNNSNYAYNAGSFQKDQQKRPNNKMYGSNYDDFYPRNNKKTDKLQKQGTSQRNKYQNNFQGLNRMESKMSYGSNFEKQKPNFYQSDYINQDEGNNKGPLNAMKFSSSSFDSDVQPLNQKGPNRFNRRERWPESICYEGRQYLKIDLVL